MSIQNNQDRKFISSKVQIAKYIFQQGKASKPEIAKALKISMPTVLLSTKELIEDAIIKEIGMYESTGGRKAKILTIVEDKKYSIGIDITANHISFVMINLVGKIICSERLRVAFSNSNEYYEYIISTLAIFIEKSCISKDKILGVGISLPGIISKKDGILVKSHALLQDNLPLRPIAKRFDFPVFFDNDANCAAMAESKYICQNAIYLSLSNTVGGAIFMNHKIYSGDNFRSAEFGHIIIDANGKKCYCGKNGCIDAYCSAKVLAQITNNNLEDYFNLLDAGDQAALELWDTYLEYLAITITNLRVSFDCDIILGGYVGGYLNNYSAMLSDRVLKYSLFENSTSFLKFCNFKNEASAVGIALHFVDAYFNSIY